ncbi:transforming growth factor-beta-induced protein ig-h3-like [Physella acuta]|uniref:transforming growth factor-beta-induced protein ig-h3-like n=1 Tax=Physella acuta TaxID=109671 RepID=UPI0027DC5C21|nr:transforming growth factor-beta-induced protein ig-h3-like [Physella acuta]
MYFAAFYLFGFLFSHIDGQVTTTRAPPPGVVDALTANGHFTVFLDLLQASTMLPRINASNHSTIFAPTDAAFARMPAGTVDSLKADNSRLESVIGYHVALNTSYHIQQAAQQDRIINSSSGLPIRVNNYTLLHTVTAEGVNVTIKNIRVYHGYIHGIDGLMTPPVGNILDIGRTRQDISTFESLITKANLTHQFTTDHSTTFFVPNNDAFAKLSPQVMDYLSTHTAALADVLRYHLVKTYTMYSAGMLHSITVNSADQHHDTLMILEDASGNFFVNNAKIQEKDISSINGVVHIIDSVLIPSRVTVAIADAGIIVG